MEGRTPSVTITRPALANKRVKVNRNGDVVLKLKSAYRDGITHLAIVNYWPLTNRIHNT